MPRPLTPKEGLHLKKGHPGERIILVRHRNGWSQAEVANAAEISPNTVSNIELGKRFSHAALEAIAVALGTTAFALQQPID